MPVSSSEVLDSLNIYHSYANSMGFCTPVAEDTLVSVSQTNIPLIINIQLECISEGNYRDKYEGKIYEFAGGIYEIRSC
jgi:hypothetical protein